MSLGAICGTSEEKLPRVPQMALKRSVTARCHKWHRRGGRICGRYGKRRHEWPPQSNETLKLKIHGRIVMRKNIIGITVLLIVSVFGLTACSQASRVESNLTKEADNFNVVRQLTVINCLQGDVLFQMTGKMAITADTEDNQLEIIVENEDGNYTKHFVGLSDNVTYIVEDLNLGANDVEKYKYTLNFNPEMWFPVEVETID